MINYTKREFNRKSKKYVAGRMELEEMIAFEDYLDENPIQQMMVEGMCILHNTFDGKPPKVHTTFEYRLRNTSIVASVVLLFIVGTYLLKGRQPLVPDNNRELVKKREPVKQPESDKKSTTDSLSTPVRSTPDIFKKPEKKPKKKKTQEFISPQLLAFNKQEIKFWEDELAEAGSYRSNFDIEVLSLKSSGNQTIFKVKYTSTGNPDSSRLFITIYSSKNMTKPLVDDIPFRQVKGKQGVFIKTFTLPTGSTYYWKLMDEEDLLIGKLIK